MSTVQKSTLFPTELVPEMFNLVRGHSSIAKMAGAKPVPFVGETQFTFNLDNEVEILAEGGARAAGGATVAPKVVTPIKFTYNARFSREYLTASEEKKIETLKEFANGFAKALGKGLDIAAVHGVNPKTGSASSVIGNNHLDYVVANYSSGANKITWTSGTDNPVDKLDEAISKIDAPTGIIFGKTLRQAIADLPATSGGNAKAYPEFAWGQTPGSLGGMQCDANKTVESNSSKDRAIVADFNCFKWGYGQDIKYRVVEYGNPDGGTYDLQRADEVCIIGDAFIGWAFMDESQFAEVVAP